MAHHPVPAPTSENLFPYNITLETGAAGANLSTYKITSPFQANPFQDTTQTVNFPAGTSVLFFGENFTITGETDTQEYLGTAVDSSGAVVGFIFKDVTTGSFFLFSTSNNLASIRSPETVTLDLSTGISDPQANNWDLSTGAPVAFCFMAGTGVRTPTGDVAVETLKTGDLVTLNDGRIAPVSWLGRQTVSTQFADPLRSLPVRIKANALGEGLPQRDMLLSPDHALLVDGILAQAGALVNGVSIVRETRVPAVFTYYHVEVADHSLILAENVPAETFVDNVDRMAFDNWEEHQKLYGDAPSVPEMDYPRAKAVRQVPQATRDRLFALGEALYGTQRAA
jgi:hypothetical protein